MKPTGGQIVVETLIREGVPHSVGIPGHGTLGLSDTLIEQEQLHRAHGGPAEVDDVPRRGDHPHRHRAGRVARCFVDRTRHLIDVLKSGGQSMLDGSTGKAVLQFTLAAHISVHDGKEVRPDEVSYYWTERRRNIPETNALEV